jgi:hypothetical protein
VVIDSPPFGNQRSEWVNPFMAGVPRRVERFDPPAATESGAGP